MIVIQKKIKIQTKDTTNSKQQEISTIHPQHCCHLATLENIANLIYQLHNIRSSSGFRKMQRLYS